MKSLPKISLKWLFFTGRWPLWQAYAVAVAATVATLFIRNRLGVAFGERPLLIMFMFPIILSACLGGVGPGMASTILSAAIVDYFLIPPTHSFRISQSYDAVQLFMLVMNGVLVSFLTEALHRFRVSAESRTNDFNRANRQLEEEISERKRAEEKLRRERALLRCLIDSASDLIFIKDRDGAYLGCNRASAAFMGIPECEQIGKTDFDFFDRERAEAIRENDRQVLEEGKPFRIEEWVTTRNGVKMSLDTLKAPFYGPDGEVLGLVGICRDISERKNLENQLRQAQKMEAIGTLTGGIAHEFNNIMTAVIGYGCILKLELADSAKLLPKVDALLHAADRAAILVRSLLSFSCKQESELKSIDLNLLISREGELLRRIIRKDIELNVSLDDSLPVVIADHGQIRQLLVNLINNALDAMPKGGEIAISTASVKLDRKFNETHGFGKPGEYALLTISDSGEGMEEKIRQKIFEPFFTTREVGKGTGLGLSICYGIIKQHDGYIVCESDPGKGTTFTIYLPLNLA